MLRRSFLAILLACLFVSPFGHAAGVQHFVRGSVVVQTDSGAHKIVVELATTEDEREQGLMFRSSLDKDSGMLFLYPSEQPIAMWMKNTLIPLDMLFIAADGTITHIQQRAVPQSLATISSGGLVRGALELNGGTVARLGIKNGDKVIGEGLGQ